MNYQIKTPLSAFYAKLERIIAFSMALLLLMPSIIFSGEADKSRFNQYSEEIRTAVSGLQESYPDVQFLGNGRKITSVYGTAFEFGSSPEETADRFAREYAAIFGARSEELVEGLESYNRPYTQQLVYNPITDDYKFTLVYYSQYLDDIPVFRSELRLLVRNEPGYPLVLAKSRLHDLRDFVDKNLAAMSLEDIKSYIAVDNSGLDKYTRPETVIWAGLERDLDTPRLGYQVIASNDNPESWLYIVGAETGEILFKENQIIFENINGEVQGNSTVGTAPDICEEEVSLPLPYATVESSTSTALTDENGSFSIDASLPDTVRSYIEGLYFNVNNMAGEDAELDHYAVSPGSIDFIHNEANTDEYYRAQVNAYIYANKTRDFVLNYNPTYPGVFLNVCREIFVNRSDAYCPCNAWYSTGCNDTLCDDPSISFCVAGSLSGYPDIDCPNTAFSHAVHHEYGHHLVNMAGSPQWSYGEGIADAIAVLITDDPELSPGFFGDCYEFLRSADNDIQFPCDTTVGPHYCGQLLSGAIWDVRNELILKYPSTYLDTLSNLTVNSILLNDNGYITPQIVIDFLTIDDDDPDITNGTPHMLEICAGFGAHNLRCPEFQVFDFIYSEDFPEYIDPDSSFSVQVEIVPRGPDAVIPGTGAFYYAVNGFDYQEGTCTEISNNVYELTFPDFVCGEMINWYVTAESDRFGPIHDPYYYDNHPYKIVSATEKIVIFEDDFNQNNSWTVVNSSDILGGEWERGIPITGEEVHGSPPTDYDGSGYCYLTENASDVSALRHGVTSLISPGLDLSIGITRLDYARWFYNQVAGMYIFPDDPFRVYVSDDNGDTWSLAEEVDPYYNDEHSGGWFESGFVINDYVNISNGTKIKFDAVNNPKFMVNMVEAAVDDVSVSLYLCIDTLTIYTTILPDATFGHPYSFQLGAFGGEGEITWSDKYNDLGGTAFSLSSTGLLTGTPYQQGEIFFTALAEDAVGQTAEQLLSIKTNNSVQIVDNFPESWTLGGRNEHHFEASGGSPPYVWSNPAGNLGTDSDSTWAMWVLHYFDKWFDGSGEWGWGVEGRFYYEDSLWFDLAVEDQVGDVDTIEVIIYTNDTINIITEFLPDAIAGQEYYTALEYTDGTPPFKFRQVHYNFTNMGLTLDSLTGEISGYPDTLGLCSLEMKVKDTCNVWWLSDGNDGYWEKHRLKINVKLQEGCGDMNLDDQVNLMDITYLINYLYKNGPAPAVENSGDVNSSGVTNLLDITFLIAFLYKDGPYPYCPFD